MEYFRSKISIKQLVTGVLNVTLSCNSQLLMPIHRLMFPKEVWDERGLLSECPKCKRPLKFNPFIVDNRDRY